MRFLPLPITMFFITFSLVCTFSSSTIASEPVGEKVKTVCTHCHSSRRICKNIGKKDLADWNKTVTRMMGKKALLNQDEIPLAASYIHSLPPKTNHFCD